MIKINLPVLLAERGIKVSDVSRQIDISRSTLYRLYNNDVIKIDVDAIDKLCRFLDCTPGDILLYEDNAKLKDNTKEQTN